MFVPITPNWTSPPRTTYTYQTSVFETEERTEYREAVRATPRRVIEFEAWPGNQRLVRDYVLRNIRVAEDGRPEPYSIPDVTQPIAWTSGILGPSGVMVPINERPAWMVPGARVALIFARRVIEARVSQVAMLTAEQDADVAAGLLAPGLPAVLPIDLSTGLGGAVIGARPGALPHDLSAGPLDMASTLPPDVLATMRPHLVIDSPPGVTLGVGTILAPIIDGWFERASISQFTGEQGNMSVRFAVLPASEPAVEGARGTLLPDGHEVFVERPDWSDRPTYDYASAIDVVDFDFGVIAARKVSDFRSRTMGLVHRQKGAPTRRMIQFIQRQRGRRGAFWRPTWTSDLTLANALEAGQNYLRVAGGEIAIQYGNLTAYRALAVIMRDGTVIPRRILGMTSTAGETWITLEEPIRRNVTAQNIDMICWLSLCRFASDEFTVSWKTSDYAEIALSCVELPARDLGDAESIFDSGMIWFIQEYGEEFAEWFADRLQVLVNERYPEAVNGG